MQVSVSTEAEHTKLSLLRPLLRIAANVAALGGRDAAAELLVPPLCESHNLVQGFDCTLQMQLSMTLYKEYHCRCRLIYQQSGAKFTGCQSVATVLLCDAWSKLAQMCRYGGRQYGPLLPDK